MCIISGLTSVCMSKRTTCMNVFIMHVCLLLAISDGLRFMPLLYWIPAGELCHVDSIEDMRIKQKFVNFPLMQLLPKSNYIFPSDV